MFDPELEHELFAHSQCPDFRRLMTMILSQHKGIHCIADSFARGEGNLLQVGLESDGVPGNAVMIAICCADKETISAIIKDVELIANSRLTEVYGKPTFEHKDTQRRKIL